jgi:hypothetical protein
MNAATIVLWALAGWCGNEPPAWWWWIHWHWPPPPPDPDPWPIRFGGLIGVGAGIIGGFSIEELLKFVMLNPQPEPPMIAATALGAYFVSRVVGSLLYRATRGLDSSTRRQ